MAIFLVSESEWAFLSGMFTHMRNLFSWQKLPQCNRISDRTKNTDNKKKNEKEQVNKE